MDLPLMIYDAARELLAHHLHLMHLFEVEQSQEELVMHLTRKVSRTLETYGAMYLQLRASLFQQFQQKSVPQYDNMASIK